MLAAALPDPAVAQPYLDQRLRARRNDSIQFPRPWKRKDPGFRLAREGMML